MKLVIIIVLTLCSVALGASVVLNAFNAGELSLKLEGNIGLQEYYAGSRILENMVVTIQGPVVKRPGVYYIADANVATAVRIIDFDYSTEEAYGIELGNKYMRFFKEE